jgi:hypothetical protein
MKILSKMVDKEEPVYFDNRANYKDRMKQKQLVEENLWEKIQAKVPWQLNISDAQKDMSGIDASFDTLKDGRPVSKKTIQLKAREYGGDDITMELIRPWREKIEFTGRDGKINVDKYFCIDTNKTLRIIDGHYLKSIAQNMVVKFVSAYQKNKSLQLLKTDNGDVRIFREPSQESTNTIGKVDKILVFINPSTVKVLFECQI